MASIKLQIDLLRNEFNQWGKLLATLDEDKISQLKIDNGWTVKDILGHLTSWQQVTLARLTAAYEDNLPIYPDWFPGKKAESKEDLDRINIVIYRSHKDRSWKDVLQEWQERFQKILALCPLIPEADLLAIGKYSWLSEDPLVEVLIGTREHHEEHRQSLINHIQ
jgi:hypothetical protein